MVKEPVAGRAKTRLARDVGVAPAVGFARTQAQALIARLAGDRRWVTYLAVAPDTALGSRAWPLRLARLPQGRGDLGRRMQHCFAASPPGPVIIVGADIPGVRAAMVARAFGALRDHDAVFGPAGDGGYWLIGLKRRPRLLRPFADVRWSSEHALSDTLANLAGGRVAYGVTLADVDNGADLARAAALAGRRILPAWAAR